MWTDEALICTKCPLCTTRTNVVLSRGPLSASVMIVGEAPGEVEDRTGLPFTGPSGRLLDLLIHKAGGDSSRVYFCNVIKCRPPNNRTPSTTEIVKCRPYLLQQIEAVQPAVIVTAGKVATSAVTGIYGLMSVLLMEQDMRCGHSQIPVIPIYHPSYLLRRMTDAGASDEFKDTIMRLKRAFLSMPLPPQEATCDEDLPVVR